MRLASQLRCLRSERGSIPLRGASANAVRSTSVRIQTPPPVPRDLAPGGVPTFHRPLRGASLLRTSSNGRTAVFQAAHAGSIPAVRSTRAEPRVRIAVCKTAREGATPSRLSAPRARWTSHRPLNGHLRVRIPGGALRRCHLAVQEAGLSSRATWVRIPPPTPPPCPDGFRPRSPKPGSEVRLLAGRLQALVLAAPGLRFLNAMLGCDSRRGRERSVSLPVLAAPGIGLRSRLARFDSSQGDLRFPPWPARALERTRAAFHTIPLGKENASC